MNTEWKQIMDASPAGMSEAWERDDLCRDSQDIAYVERWYTVSQVYRDGSERPVFIRVYHESGTVLREEPLGVLTAIRGQ